MSRKVDLLKEPILPALTRLALPIMATSLVQMAYNLTDMAWIGRLGAGAVTAVGSAGMYTWFSQGFAILARTGGQVKAAHCLGAGETEEASLYARGAVQVGLLFALMYGLVSFFGARQLIGFFGLSSPEIIREAQAYLQIACGLIVFSYLNAILTGLLTAAGDSRTPFMANVAGLAVNVILDPVLIWTWPSACPWGAWRCHRHGAGPVSGDDSLYPGDPEGKTAVSYLLFLETSSWDLYAGNFPHRVSGSGAEPDLFWYFHDADAPGNGLGRFGGGSTESWRSD